MNTDTWIPDGLSLDKPNVARIYDYLLDGYHNFEIDRLVADKMLKVYPDIRLGTYACRAFLRRVVNFLVELLLLLVLQAIGDDKEAYGAARTLRDALATDSYIAISHGTRDNAPPEVVEQMEKLSAGTFTPVTERSRARLQPFFDGLELVEPGLVRLPLWRPEGPDDILLDRPERVLAFGGVGRKP